MLREDDISILEEAAAGDEAAMAQLHDVFDLPASYRDALVRVLQEGAWRESDEPVDFVYRATAPRRAQLRDEQGHTIEYLADRDTNRREVVLGDSTVAWLTREIIHDTKSGVWRQGVGLKRERDEPDTAPNSIRHVPVDLRMTRAAHILPDWTRIAERARLDPWETKALECMAAGLTRYSAMRALSDERDKRALEAAWKRLERSNFKKIRSILV